MKSLIARFLLAAGLLALPLLTSTLALASNNLLLPTIPVKIINQNPASAGGVFVTIIGQVATKNGDWYYVSDLSGNVQPVPSSNKTAIPPLSLGAVGNATIQIPQMYNARIYLSYVNGMQITGGAGSGSTPAGWSSGDPNYDTVFDWVEYTFGPGKPVSRLPVSNVPLNVNLSQVDMFGLALVAQLSGAAQSNGTQPTTIHVGFKGTGVRQTILSQFKKAGAPWSDLVVTDLRGKFLRVMSPIHYGDFTGSAYYAKYQNFISNVYSNYKGSDKLKAKVLGLNMNGQTSGNSLVFKGGKTSIAIPQPTLETLLGGTPRMGPSSNASTAQVSRLQAKFSAAMLRTNVLPQGGSGNFSLDDCAQADFYVKGPVYQYGSILHANSYDEKAYALAPDDQCDQSSDMQVFNPTAFTITIRGL